MTPKRMLTISLCAEEQMIRNQKLERTIWFGVHINKGSMREGLIIVLSKELICAPITATGDSTTGVLSGLGSQLKFNLVRRSTREEREQRNDHGSSKLQSLCAE